MSENATTQIHALHCRDRKLSDYYAVEMFVEAR